MFKRMSMLYGTLMLTAGNLLLRLFATGFQVYLSSAIGAAGIGLLHLILSVSGLFLTAGAAGIRTTAMYLTAEEMGRKRPGAVRWVVIGCFFYSMVCSCAAALGLYFSAPYLAANWLGAPGAASSLRTFSAFIPLMCLSSVMTGFFLSANRIGVLALVEIAEQLCSMGITALILLRIPSGDPAAACHAVILGSCCGNVFTLLCLFGIYRRIQPRQFLTPRIGKRIVSTAVPLGLADDLRTGISSLEHLMVPRRLSLFPSGADPLAVFGMVAGMVFPVMMFPAAILYSLVDILIPEMARCSAAGSRSRIQYLIRRNLRVTLLYGLVWGGILFLWAEILCQRLFPGSSAGVFLARFSVLVPMLYCDIVTDGITKGLGQQRSCVRYNIISNGLDVVLLFFLLPKLGMTGYFISFAVTHMLNFALSLRRLLHLGALKLQWHTPMLAVASCLTAVFCASRFTGSFRKIAAFAGLFFCLCYFWGVITPMDIQWAKKLLTPPHRSRNESSTPPA